MYRKCTWVVGRAVPERRHMLSGLDRLLVISWLVLVFADLGLPFLALEICTRVTIARQNWLLVC